MKRLLPLFVALVLTLAGGGSQAEQLTIALSTAQVNINSNFTGTNITVFGVIERDASTVSRMATGYDVVTVVLGPPETIVARRKDRVLGIWVNRASATIIRAPSFYALNASAGIPDIAPDPVLDRLGLGFDNIGFVYEGRARINDPSADEFRDAFLRLKQRSGLYTEQGGIDFFGDSVFRATIRIPANVPDGRYSVLVYLFAGDALLARADERISVSKIGFEQLMFSFATTQSLVYGLICVALAMSIGWLGGVIFRRD